MKQIFIPNIQFKLDKMHKYLISEENYLIAISSRGLYHFQNNNVKKIIENIIDNYVITFESNNKHDIELFINVVNIDSLHVTNLPLDIILISNTKKIYKFNNIYIHVENQSETKQIWFECDDCVTMNTIVDEMSSIIPLINV